MQKDKDFDAVGVDEMIIRHLEEDEKYFLDLRVQIPFLSKKGFPTPNDTVYLTDKEGNQIGQANLLFSSKIDTVIEKSSNSQKSITVYGSVIFHHTFDVSEDIEMLVNALEGGFPNAER